MTIKDTQKIGGIEYMRKWEDIVDEPYIYDESMDIYEWEETNETKIEYEKDIQQVRVNYGIMRYENRIEDEFQAMKESMSYITPEEFAIESYNENEYYRRRDEI